MIRGTVTALASNTVTLRSEDGDTVEIAVTPNTRIVHSGQPARLANLHIGDGVGAGGVLDPATHTLHAAFLGFVDAEEVRRAQADLGKTYIIGRITAIDLDRLHLTIHRPDNTTQVIAVDESTDFRLGGRSSNAGPGFGRGRVGGEDAVGPRRRATPNQGNTEPGSPTSGTSTGEPITLAEIKVGESVAGRGSIKNGLFTPTELHIYKARPHPAAPHAQGDPDPKQ